jgi:hypothetical protein
LGQLDHVNKERSFDTILRSLPHATTPSIVNLKSGCWSTAGFRTRLAHSPEKTSSCGIATPASIVPRSRAGETTWENLVACCHQCNNRKGIRTPDESGMKLVRALRPFSLHTSRHLMRLLGKSDDQWRKYLFY